MSDTQTPGHDPNRPSSGLRGCGAALLIILGVILLLPGVCSLIFISGGMGNDLAGLGLLVSLGGVVLIVYAVRSLMRPK